MTCQSCVANVTQSLSAIEGVDSVVVNLEKKEALVISNKLIELDILKASLPKKFSIASSVLSLPSTMTDSSPEKSKLEQLRPLFLILFYIGVASFLLHRQDMDFKSMMTDFMGLFFIVFSFFKMLDIKGFASSFRMYDPIASILPAYAIVYPFVETILGLMLLFRYNVKYALIATIVVLGFTTFGITKSLLAKRSIKCACLGTALDLPMTEATFIENALMIVMSLVMLSI